MVDKYSTVVVCERLNISQQTLQKWYHWYKTKTIDCPELPVPTKLGRCNFYTNDDIIKLSEFKRWLPRGCKGIMSK